jgi:uncharacterized protein
MKQSGEESGSERTCIATGAKGAPEAMLRFALGADGSVVPDIRRKLPGRGVWTRLNAEAVRRAAAKGAFARAFRAKVEASAGLADAVDALLERDALQSLSMANKAGMVVSGAFKVDSAIENGGIAILIEASDGAADGIAKRAKALRAKVGPAGTIARINLFSSGQLDLALGKANVIHAALKSGAASSAFLARAERLRTYRASEADGTCRTQSGGAPADGAATLGWPDELAEGPSD